MAILFSIVTVSTDDNQIDFLSRGIPRDQDDLDCCEDFEDFTGAIEEETEIEVHVEAYLYGDGETVDASEGELVHLKDRIERDGRFLANLCDNLEDVDFTILWSLDKW